MMIGGIESPEPTQMTRQQLDEFFVQQLPWLRAMVRLNGGAQLRDQESCSDLVQTVCRQLLERGVGVEYRDAKSLRSWLFTAVLNKIKQRNRHYGAKKRAGDAGSVPFDDAMLVNSYAALCSPSHHAILKEQVDLLERAFDRLPEHYQEVLSCVVGLSQEETAAQMNRTVPSMRNLLSRALVELAIEMAAVQRG